VTTTLIFLTAGSSWTVPADWNSASNSVETLAGGGGGGQSATYGQGGGGGGAYSKVVNLSLSPGASIIYGVGAGGVSAGAGGDTWFNGSSLASCSVGAQGGRGGATTRAGGASASGVGSTKYSGGDGGAAGFSAGGGGGGAAGPFGAGASGTAATGGNFPGAGGGGDNTHGGAGGAAGSTSANAPAGSPGAEWDASHGSGGGGGGGAASLYGYFAGGAAGLYGAGGGGSASGTVSGAPGIIVISYTPIALNTVSETVGLTDLAVAQGDASAAQGESVSLTDSSVVGAVDGFEGDQVGLADVSTATVDLESVWTEAVRLLTRGDAVNIAYGVEFTFRSKTMACWEGFGPLDATAFGGPIFYGIGNMGRIGPLELGSVAQTEGVTFELSGLDPTFFAEAQNQSTEVRGFQCRVYFNFFDADWKLVDSRPRRTFQMDRIKTSVSMQNEPPTMVLTLSAEPILATKNAKPNAYLTDADQRSRYPGDRSLERIGELSVHQTVTWQ